MQNVLEGQQAILSSSIWISLCIDISWNFRKPKYDKVQSTSPVKEKNKQSELIDLVLAMNLYGLPAVPVIPVI